MLHREYPPLHRLLETSLENPGTHGIESYGTILISSRRKLRKTVLPKQSPIMLTFPEHISPKGTRIGMVGKNRAHCMVGSGSTNLAVNDIFAARTLHRASILVQFSTALVTNCGSVLGAGNKSHRLFNHHHLACFNVPVNAREGEDAE